MELKTEMRISDLFHVAVLKKKGEEMSFEVCTCRQYVKLYFSIMHESGHCDEKITHVKKGKGENLIVFQMTAGG